MYLALLNSTPLQLFQQSGGIDWRSKIDNQRGAVLATELKNNNSKLAKWTICSLLAGSSQIKFGLLIFICTSIIDIHIFVYNNTIIIIKIVLSIIILK